MSVNLNLDQQNGKIVYVFAVRKQGHLKINLSSMSKPDIGHSDNIGQISHVLATKNPITHICKCIINLVGH